MNKDLIKKILSEKSSQKSIDLIETITTEEDLFILVNNYNWDNGLEIPAKILSHPNCTLNIAFFIFYLADGLIFLYDKTISLNLPAWDDFIRNLYNSILDNSFPIGNSRYINELTKVEKYKLSKILTNKEIIFLQEFEGNDYYFEL